MSLSPEDAQALRDITATHIRTAVEGDWASWTDTCTDDVILIPPGDNHVHGRETAREWFGSFPRFVEFSGEPMVVRGGQDMAFTTGVATAKLDVDGEIVDTSIKWLAVFERQDDGGWKLAADAWNE